MGLLAPANDRALRVGLVAQSGAMMSAIREAARARGVGFSHMISTGNEAVVGMEDFTAELIADETTRVIALFLEQIRRPRLFLALAARAREAGKTIVMFHSGRSAAARAAARSHTGALAGDFRTMAALVAHQGVVRVDVLRRAHRHDGIIRALSAAAGRRRRGDHQFGRLLRHGPRRRGGRGPGNSTAVVIGV